MTNEEVAVAFVNQSLPEAKSCTGNFSFKGTSLYSYASLLAKVGLKDNALYIDKDISKYSNTTQKHTSKLLSAAHPMQVFYIYLGEYPETNMQRYWKSIEAFIVKHRRARKYKDHYKAQIQSTIQEAQLFAKLHNEPTEIPDDLMRQLFVNQLL